MYQNQKFNILVSSLYETIPLLATMVFLSGVMMWIVSIFCMTLW